MYKYDCVQNGKGESASVSMFPVKRANPHAAEQLRDILWKLATKQLRPNEWKKLAKHWNFSDAQLRAIEHQYTGTSVYSLTPTSTKPAGIITNDFTWNK